jgi:capsular polysaccharide biosynthesis protein
MFWSAFLRRRAGILIVIFGVVLVATTILAIHDLNTRGYRSSAKLLVTEKRPASISTAITPNGLGQAGAQSAKDISQALNGLTAAAWIRRESQLPRPLGSPQTGCIAPVKLTPVQIERDLNASASGRTVTITATARSTEVVSCVTRLAVVLAGQERSVLLGHLAAGRELVRTIAYPWRTRVPALPIVRTLILRIIIGLVLAFAIAFAWDYLDGSVRSPAALEAALGAPVLARVT